jgi:hypothetical protein
VPFLGLARLKRSSQSETASNSRDHTQMKQIPEVDTQRTKTSFVIVTPVLRSVICEYKAGASVSAFDIRI